MFVFFFKQKTAYELRISDWSSDVCSSDLAVLWQACFHRPVPPPVMRLNGDLGGKFRTEAAPDTIKPTLRLRDVIALTVGIIIGAGIFRTPSLVAGASS